MTTATKEKPTEVSAEEYKAQVMERLKPAMFEVETQKLYRMTKNEDGTDALEETKVRAVVNRDENNIVSYVSDKYRLMPFKETLEPAVERMLDMGWRMPNDVAGRRMAVRLESGGRRATVELVHPQARVDMGEGKKHRWVHARVVIGNSYDATSRMFMDRGGFELICTNGLVSVSQYLRSVGRRHIGTNDSFDGDRLKVMAEEFLENYEKISEGWKELKSFVPGEEKALEAIETVSVRSRDTIVEKVQAEYLKDATGWQVYQGITNYLTHDFKGGHGLFKRKQQRALAALMDARN